MSFESVEQAIVYVLKNQKDFIKKEVEFARARGDTESVHRHQKRIDNMGFGVQVDDLTDEHEEARVDELFVWIERFEEKPRRETRAKRSECSFAWLFALGRLSS